MTARKKSVLGAVALCLSLLLGGCSLPGTSFADYDVSGYFQALFDSCYKGENEDYMAVAGTNEAGAQQNNVTTVENAAVNFCNTYGLSPSDSQLGQLEEVMRQAFLSASYVVKDEEKVESGYYLEVEIDPIVNFQNLEDTISQLREEAEQEATQANSSSREESSADEESGDGYDYGYDDGYGDSQDTTEEDVSSSALEEDTEPVAANTLFVDKVIAYCQGQLNALQHSGTAVTISLDIRQTSEGELLLDTNQLDTIDRTVLPFHS